MTGPNTDTRYAIDRQLLERLLGDDKAFKERLLVDLTELKVNVRVLTESFHDHVADDKQKFDKVSLSIGENTGNLKTIAGGITVAVFLITIGVGLAKVLL